MLHAIVQQLRQKILPVFFLDETHPSVKPPPPQRAPDPFSQSAGTGRNTTNPHRKGAGPYSNVAGERLQAKMGQEDHDPDRLRNNPGGMFRDDAPGDPDANAGPQRHPDCHDRMVPAHQYRNYCAGAAARPDGG